MGWLSGLGDRWARRQMAMPDVLYIREAMRFAPSSMDDEDARREIEQRVPFDQAGITAAVQRMARNRSDYLSDRAFRLLAAIADGGPVRPIDPALADLFTQERELGQMPLADAFARLAELEPRLLALEHEPAAPPIASDDAGNKERKLSWKAMAGYVEKLDDLVGLDASKRLPILRSDISVGIVMQFLEVKAGVMPGKLTDSYFNSPHRIASSSLSSSRKDARPQATN